MIFLLKRDAALNEPYLFQRKATPNNAAVATTRETYHSRAWLSWCHRYHLLSMWFKSYPSCSDETLLYSLVGASQRQRARLQGHAVEGFVTKSLLCTHLMFARVCILAALVAVAAASCSGSGQYESS